MANTTLTVNIIDFRPVHKPAWKAINEAWITRSYYMEEIDHQHCSNPEGSILAGGGQILLAEIDGKIVGTAGLIKDDQDTYELIKMAVDENFQGLGIGRILCLAAIERAKDLGAKLLYLYSNTGGSDVAIQLYRKLGFVEVPLDRQDFKRADIMMKMWFY
jgi:GNAT superfamily N-acetyltransferase